MFYWLVETFGSPGKPYYDALVIWKFLIYIVAITIVFYNGKYLGVNPALSAIFACFALFVGRSFFDIRPAGFSNLLVGVFILILILTTYRNVLYIWFIVPMIILWCNLHGGYIYAFIMLAPFIGIHLLLSVPRKKFVPVYAAGSMLILGAYLAKTHLSESHDETTFYTAFLLVVCLAVLGVVFYFFFRPRAVTIGIKGVAHAIAATVIAFIGMIVFNPFHLTNLTHTYVISISKHAEKWRSVNEWHSAWEWSNPVGTSYPFLVMFIIAIITLVIWFINWLFKPELKLLRQKTESAPADFEWPKLDLAIIVIAALSVYMAIQSRRFIPIGAIAACPIVALFIDQTIRMIAVRITNSARTRLTVPPMPMVLQGAIIVLAVVAMAGFGGFWGWKFYRIYLAPWPDDEKYTSVFMRDDRFIRQAICRRGIYTRQPPQGQHVQLLDGRRFYCMDGRAGPEHRQNAFAVIYGRQGQAAYEPQKYDIWMAIMSGQPPQVKPFYDEGRRPTTQEVGKATDEELRKYNVWVVLMPAGELDGPLIEALDSHPDWRIVFLTNKDKMLVNIKTEAVRSTVHGYARRHGQISG